MNSDRTERRSLDEAGGRALKPLDDALNSRTTPSIPKYRYCDLGGSSREVLIEHEGQLYRLRTTRNGKLILNK